MARKCAEYGVSESGKRRCKRFVTVAEDVEISNDTVMAKGTDGKELGYFDISEVQNALGSLRGLTDMDRILPPLVGGTTALLGTLLVRKFVVDKTSMAVKAAPLIGAGAGVLVSLPLYKIYGPEGMVSGALTSLLVGGAMFGYEKLSTLPVFNGIGLPYVQHVRGGGLRPPPQQRLGAVVAQGGGARVHSTANVPANVGSAMDVGAFAGKASY